MKRQYKIIQILKMKNTPEVLTSKSDIEKEKINELEEIAIKIF